MQPIERHWQVPHDHPAFAGHFPGHAVLPGVVLLDVALQAARACMPEVGAWSIPQAKFLQPVGPGQRLLLRLDPTPQGALAFHFSREGQVVASGLLRPGGDAGGRA